MKFMAVVIVEGQSQKEGNLPAIFSRPQGFIGYVQHPSARPLRGWRELRDSCNMYYTPDGL